MKSALPIRIFSGIARVLLVALAIGAIGTLFPNIPVLGIVGSMLVGILGLWAILLTLAGSVWTFLHWRKSRSRGSLLVAALASFATIGMAYIAAQQIGVAQSHGAQINLAEALFARTQADDRLKPETIFYAKHGKQDLPLDVYRPKARSDGKLAPVFIYIHGGGWGAETLKQRQADYRWFVERGYVVMSFEYPLSSEQQQTWNVTHPLLGCALVWANANAARYGGDASRIALWGESAGGNLALNVAYKANAGTLNPSCPGALPQIRATVGLYPIIDAALMHDNPDPITGIFARMMATRYTGGTPKQFPDRYAEISAGTHISAKAPPTLLIIPQSDLLLAADAANGFAAKARAADIETQLIPMPYAGHSFDIKSGSIGNQMVRQTMLKFLRKHGLAP